MLITLQWYWYQDVKSKMIVVNFKWWQYAVVKNDFKLNIVDMHRLHIYHIYGTSKSWFMNQCCFFIRELTEAFTIKRWNELQLWAYVLFWCWRCHVDCKLLRTLVIRTQLLLSIVQWDKRQSFFNCCCYVKCLEKSWKCNKYCLYVI